MQNESASHKDCKTRVPAPFRGGVRQHIGLVKRYADSMEEHVSRMEINAEVQAVVLLLRYEHKKPTRAIEDYLKTYKTVEDKDGRLVPDSRYFRTARSIEHMLSRISKMVQFP